MQYSKEVPCGSKETPGEVISPGDLLRGRLSVFRRKVSRALGCVERAATRGKIGVAFSGGKDSTVTLDLVRQVVPDAVAIFYNDGAQLADTYAFIAKTPNVNVIKVEPDLLEMCRIGGYWGYQSDTPDVEFDFGYALIEEPSARVVKEHGLGVVAIGLRGEESTGRHFNARRKGELYWCKEYRVWHLCPVQFWTVEDIWAYVATQGLAYNVAYDKMAALGMKREEMRVAPVLGAAAVGFGQYAYLKQLDPELWNRLVAEFPKIGIYV